MNLQGQRESICFLTNAYPDDESSYRGIFVKGLATRLAQRGYDISMVTPRIFKHSPLAENNRRGLSVRRFPFWSEDRLLITYRRIPWARMVTYLLSGLYWTWKTVRQNRCRLIHAHWVVPTGMMGVLVGKSVGVPVIVHARGSDIHTFSRRSRFLSGLARFTLRNADLILAVSEGLRRTIAEDFGIPFDKMRVSMTGIDSSLFRPMDKMAQREVLNLPVERDIILFVGSLVAVKGLNYLIQALPGLRRLHGDRLLLLIVGEGDLERDLREMALSSGLEGQVRFVGRVPNDQIPVWMNAADFFVLPSLDEGTPNAVLEALSCGLPVLASRVGGTVDLIEDGFNGLLFEPARAGSIVDKLNLLLNDRSLCERLRNHARTKMAEYSAEHQTAVLEKIYESFLVARTSVS